MSGIGITPQDVVVAVLIRVAGSQDGQELGAALARLGDANGDGAPDLAVGSPGWDADGRTLDTFTDVRDIQKTLNADGGAFASEAGETTSGPASCMVFDPDGNPILIDQHV